MKKFLMTMVMALCVSLTTFAQSNSDRISFGVGALYERGLDATLSWEHETKYHNAWEFFANGYIKWADCESCGHVCPESFWKNYRTWGVGTAYKPCVWRSRNNHGNLRIGASVGSNTDKFVGGIHAGESIRRAGGHEPHGHRGDAEEYHGKRCYRLLAVFT